MRWYTIGESRKVGTTNNAIGGNMEKFRACQKMRLCVKRTMTKEISPVCMLLYSTSDTDLLFKALKCIECRCVVTASNLELLSLYELCMCTCVADISGNLSKQLVNLLVTKLHAKTRYHGQSCTRPSLLKEV